ncbi:(Fe-S)-binding protein [Prosthecobacter sp.]|uniref:(Fe-S)-binding protein n=1 Tax=Prosthecobacter sp. TaxID=1965333 RepID=UPI002AB98977|nr:(Fe-S)-binding protein [Prosthecobacter sp.]MDZ4404642.1 (Fe-S)-binding protein [Prosthecobacter sp.]
MPQANLLKSLDYSVLQQCMHCGMCLPTCPTYVETKMEKNSPRGRIALLRAVADGDLEVSRALSDEMYYCLGCLACQTACPAGVNYAELFETARAEVEQAEVNDGMQRGFWRWLTLNVIFMRPWLLRLIGRVLRVYQSAGLDNLMRKLRFFGLMPRSLAKLEPQTPQISEHFSDDLIWPEESPKGRQEYRVGLLTGCIQDLAFSNINRDTADVLLANGCEVITPRSQSCCGSLHAHNGELELARELARRQIDSFDLDSLDAIITNAGGCGSHLKTYGHLLHDDPFYAAKAKVWDATVKDIHEWLVQIGFRKPTAGAGVSEVTYHESCHLCHGQKVVSQPRQVLASIPGLVFKELPESNWCCGSAGIYNITQPEQSQKLLDRKVANLKLTKAPVVATSNPGCHLQLANGLRSCGDHPCQEVTQPVTLLARAYRAEQGVGASGPHKPGSETPAP